MALIIENRGRGVTLQLPPAILKTRREVKTTKLDRSTGIRSVIRRVRVFGAGLTLLSKSVTDRLPNGQPIPDSVLQNPRVRALGRQLRIKVVSADDWKARVTQSTGSKPKATKKKAPAKRRKRSKASRAK